MEILDYTKVNLVQAREKNALIYKDIAYTYNQLLQYSSLYKNYICEKCNNIDKVLIFSENTPEYIFAIYATLRADAIVVPVDVTSTDKELTYIVNDCRPELIFVAQEKRELMEYCISKIDGYTPVVMPLDGIDVSAVDQVPLENIPMTSGDKVVSIIYTSGTTGSPKGVLLTYQNYWYNVDAVVNQVPVFNTESRVLLILPLHHVFPFAGALLAPIYVGGTVYITENILPDTILRIFSEGRITVMIGVPRLYDALAKGIMKKINASLPARLMYRLAGLIGSQRFSKMIFKSAHEKFGGHLEYMVTGGVALALETDKVFRRLGFYMLDGYGMTECAPMISFTRPGEWKEGYCGRLLPGLELRIEDSGEICVKGPNVMSGYYNKPEDTALILKDGWLYTGDKGELHPKYGIKITGRIKEIMITPNGKNINPIEIENVISHSAVAIKEIAIFLYEDMVQAIIFPDMNVVRTNTGKTIEEVIRPDIEAYNKSAMNYKRIMRFHIVSQELPKTRLGKIQRFKLEALITTEKKELVAEDLSSKSKTYMQIKQMVDYETKSNARGDDHLEIDLGLDSLGKISIIAEIEEGYGVAISEVEFDNLLTLNLLSAYVEENSTESKNSEISWDDIFKRDCDDFSIPKSGVIHWVMTNLAKVCFHLFYRFTSSGVDNIPNVPCIFVGNHRSGLDGVFVASKLKWSSVKKVFFFAKTKHFNSKFSRFMAKKNNVILMDINSNVRSSLQQMYQVLNSGNSLIIFPEGTRSKDAQLKEFRESFARLSQVANVPIIPVAISGAESATYKSSRIPRFMSKINVKFLPAQYPKEGQVVTEFRDEIVKTIAEALE